MQDSGSLWGDQLPLGLRPRSKNLLPSPLICAKDPNHVNIVLEFPNQG